MRRNRKRFISAILTVVMVAAMLSGCEASKEKEQAETFTVYLWSTALYDTYAPYIQSQLPDMNIEFVVGQNDLDFYQFLKENGGLPDIITCCRFSLLDAAPLRDSLMDLSTTDEAGAIYDTYLQNFMNEDGSVNWLPVCADAHGFVTNRELFDKYNIPLPTDYESFVYACQEFEKVGIRGFTADYVYDYTCMETLQGLAIPELISPEGCKWRISYGNPADEECVSLDDTVWPVAFDLMEQFIEDTKLGPDDLALDYSPVINMYKNGEVAMFYGSSARVKEFLDQGIDTTFLPFFGQEGEQWLMTTPYFQVALNRDLTKDKTRQEKAMKVLDVMLSEDAQNLVANGQDILSYSQDVRLKLSDHLESVRPVIEQNHMYIRVASNDFFAVSKDVVSKMIQGEYDAKQAYEVFDSQLRQTENAQAETILSLEKGYSNIYYKKDGNESYSAMANSIRNMYGSDVLIAPGYSFTGSVLAADYTEKQVGNMVMPNALCAFEGEMTGLELKECVRAYVEGIEGGFTPFNRGSLPVVSGIQIKVQEQDGAYTLLAVTKDGKEIRNDDSYQVTCLNTGAYMTPFLEKGSPALEQLEATVKEAWTDYIKGGAVLAEPEDYMTLKAAKH